jgi:formamidopyrimidine-DNA glycosylase
MPELPEVETTRRGIAPHVVGRRVAELVVRERRLRWPVPQGLEARLRRQVLQRLERRAKYLLFGFDAGTLIVHLGMSGSLRMVEPGTPPGKHDHVDLVFDGGQVLRLTDPRRFGAVLWTGGAPQEHPLLAGLGPEPLSEQFNGDYLYRLSRGRRTPVKNFLMDGRIVVGVGNIYANEALFGAGIHPKRAAGRIGRERYGQLAEAVKSVLQAAIEQGGTTLRDFIGGDGRPGYFAQKLQVYGRAGEACPRCSAPILAVRVGQRSTFYCRRCQH